MLRLFGGIAEFPENADETSPRELSGHVGHQLDFRTSAIFNANDAEVFARSGEDGAKIVRQAEAVKALSAIAAKDNRAAFREARAHADQTRQDAEQARLALYLHSDS
jgi:hypothetical protein